VTGLNPFDWYGGAFLALYGFLFIGALIGSMAIASWVRPDGRLRPVTDEDELALLAGGETRLGEAILARLMARGDATIANGRVTFVPAASGRSSAEREVTALVSPAKWSEVCKRVRSAAERIERRLIDHGLLMERGEARMLGLYAAMPLALLLGYGAIKHQIGIARDRPVGFLTVLLVVTAIATLIRALKVDRRTKAGISVVIDARQNASRIRRAPTNDEAGTAVALFGTAVLVGSPMAGLHKLRQSDGGGGDSGSSDGGCGGGGCGGCGS